MPGSLKTPSANFNVWPGFSASAWGIISSFPTSSGAWRRGRTVREDGEGGGWAPAPCSGSRGGGAAGGGPAGGSGGWRLPAQGVAGDTSRPSGKSLGQEGTAEAGLQRAEQVKGRLRISYARSARALRSLLLGPRLAKVRRVGSWRRQAAGGEVAGCTGECTRGESGGRGAAETCPLCQ